jgi:hypothetical protein
MGLARVGPFRVGPLIRAGYLKKAWSLPELAAKIDVDPQALLDTIARFNAMARDGVDADFGRGGMLTTASSATPLIVPTRAWGR